MVLNSALAILAAGKNEDVSNLFVVLMGIGIVFIGLLSIVILSSLMSAIIRAIEKNKKPEAVKTTPVINAPTAPIGNRQELVAAVSACIAEELGTEVSAIRVVSMKAV